MKQTNLGRRGFHAAALGLLASAQARAARPASAPAARGKTYVLVHGAWYGGWCWDKVAQGLRAQGHAVSAPTCPGQGEQAHLLSKDITLTTHVTSIVNHLRYENLSDVILVGSGFAGVLISAVADQVPQLLKSLVYVDAMIPENGLSVFDAQPAAITKKRMEEVERAGKGIAIPVPAASGYHAPDKATLDWLVERLTPQPVGTYTEKVVLRNALGNGVPRIYVDCTASPFPPLVEVKKKLRGQGGWKWVELATHHDPMITEPEMLADCLGSVA